jgi:glycosyltransferase involved in cell wall biosynthesis
MELADVEDRFLSVIVPVFNEKQHLPIVIKRVLEQPIVAQVIIVDDCSQDKPEDILRCIVAQDSRVHLLRHVNNLGKGAAIRTGLSVVTQAYVIIQDADLEYDPADYARMLKPILDCRADVVYGSRFLNGRSVTTRIHRSINGGLTLFANVLTGLNLTDVHTCLKLFPTALLRAIPLRETRFGFCPEVTAKLSRIRGIRLIEVPVSYHPRQRVDGKKIGLKDGIRAIYCILRYTFWPAESPAEWMTISERVRRLCSSK